MNNHRILVSLSVAAVIAGACTQPGIAPQTTSPGAGATASPAPTETPSGVPAGTPSEAPTATTPPTETPSPYDYGY